MALFQPTEAPRRWLFGDPVLDVGGNGSASWTTVRAKGVNQANYAAHLNGGVQDGWNDFAKVLVPVNDMPFTMLKSVRLHPYYTESSGIDMGVCLYMHDPTDLDQRIELSHTPYTNSAAGWRELNFPTEPGGSSWFWYGTITDTPDTCPLDGGSAAYTWAQFQGDSVFSHWVIHKISFDYGYYTGGAGMDNCYLVRALINDQNIPLGPSARDHIGSEVKTYAKATVTDSGTAVALVTPATGKRIRVIAVNCTTDNIIPASFETYFGSGGTLWSDVAKAIFHTRLAAGSTQDKPGYPADSIVFPTGSQPVGAVSEAVYMRTSMNITGGGTFVITYREE